MDATQVLIRPIISEKSYVLRGCGQQVHVPHHRNAHKIQVRQAVEELFDVAVLDVRTATVKGQAEASCLVRGRTRNWKKAIVTVATGSDHSRLRGPSGAGGLAHGCS